MRGCVRQLDMPCAWKDSTFRSPLHTASYIRTPNIPPNPLHRSSPLSDPTDLPIPPFLEHSPHVRISFDGTFHHVPQASTYLDSDLLAQNVVAHCHHANPRLRTSNGVIGVYTSAVPICRVRGWRDALQSKREMKGSVDGAGEVSSGEAFSAEETEIVLSVWSRANLFVSRNPGGGRIRG